MNVSAVHQRDAYHVVEFKMAFDRLVGIVWPDRVAVFDPRYPGLRYDDARFDEPLRSAVMACLASSE